jgi:hypothetical protein
MYKQITGVDESTCRQNIKDQRAEFLTYIDSLVVAQRKRER